MTRSAIKKAFEKLDTAEQAEMLGELATSLARSLAIADQADKRVFEDRRKEEGQARPFIDVKRRLLDKSKRRSK